MDLFDWIEHAFEGLMKRLSSPPQRRVEPTAPPLEEIPMPTPVKTEFVELTLEQLSKIMPLLHKAKATAFLPYVNVALGEFEITTPLRMAAFLAQVAHESAQLRYFEEIADGSAYEGRKDLGNVFPGDGKRYKGRGPIQLTGRANYHDYGKELGLDLENSPELGASAAVGFRIAGCFWKRKGLNALADVGEFRKISIKINGINKKTGEPNGLEDRIKYYTVAKSVLGVA